MQWNDGCTLLLVKSSEYMNMNMNMAAVKMKSYLVVIVAAWTTGFYYLFLGTIFL
jgi:hypothetical protein